MTTQPAPQPSILVMGVSGSGKSTIGALLAERTGAAFIDADGLHPKENIEKMVAGIPLTDADRWPWLGLVAERITEFRVAGEPAIIGCSALKRAYRDLLRAADPRLRLVYLRGSRDELVQRLADRLGHFFPPQLLDAQLAALEEPTVDERPIVVSIGQSQAAIVSQILVALAG